MPFYLTVHFDSQHGVLCYRIDPWVYHSFQWAGFSSYLCRLYPSQFVGQSSSLCGKKGKSNKNTMIKDNGLFCWLAIPLLLRCLEIDLQGWCSSHLWTTRAHVLWALLGPNPLDWGPKIQNPSPPLSSFQSYSINSFDRALLYRYMFFFFFVELIQIYVIRA